MKQTVPTEPAHAPLQPPPLAMQDSVQVLPQRKCLYKATWPDRPDNHTGDDFLEDLKRNLYVERHSLLTVVVATGRVFQHFCSLCLFVQLYCLMLRGSLAPEMVLLGLGMLAPPLYLVYLFCSSDPDRTDLSPLRTAFGHCRLLLVLTAFILMWSPLLKSLTATISTDTIHAMTVFFLTANLLFHDYGGSAAIVSKSFSLNSGVFAAICLASRLPTSLHTFTTVELALFAFAFWPEFRRKIFVDIGASPAKPAMSLGLTFLLNLAAQCAMCFISMPAACCFLLLSCFVMLACPVMFVAMQSEKNNLHGPWDEAVIH